ncbi:histone deacetylase [uncultured Formosa sp.]|uniref:histone deacetylase family protein n=1 Tax=uncultured Formosa sp. TaxID=255435 RepID=UPI002615F7F9|nr:histone deacetylase [uncultured Formosa sp.]
MLKIAYDTIYNHPIPKGHRFPMEKYELLQLQLIYEGTCTADNFFKPNVLQNHKPILEIHDPDYFYDLLNLTLNHHAALKIGFLLSERLIAREICIASGTLQAAEYALQYGIAMNIAGGTHHAYSDHGEGFCMLNDQAIAAKHLLDTRIAKRILIVDLDVHQGNGTAEIFTNEPRVFTFSMHGKNNYPFEKEQSDLDIELDDATTDSSYLKILKNTLPKLIDEQQPDFIFYQCGVDVIASDKIGRLDLSIEGCKARDLFVLETCKFNAIPIMCSMGGGYSPEIKTIIEAHSNTFRLAQELYF